MAVRRNAVSDLDANIKQQTDKLKKLKEKKKRLMEAENIRIGKLVRKIFKDQLPETPEEQKLFFERLAKSSVVLDNKGNEVSHSDGLNSGVQPVPSVPEKEKESYPTSNVGGFVSSQQSVNGMNSPSENHEFGG